MPGVSEPGCVWMLPRTLLQFSHATWAHVRPLGRAKSGTYAMSAEPPSLTFGPTPNYLDQYYRRLKNFPTVIFPISARCGGVNNADIFSDFQAFSVVGHF